MRANFSFKVHGGPLECKSELCACRVARSRPKMASMPFSPNGFFSGTTQKPAGFDSDSCPRLVRSQNSSHFGQALTIVLWNCCGFLFEVGAQKVGFSD